MKNITFSVDEALIDGARRIAASRNTTLNAEFGPWLADYVGRHRQSERPLAALDAVAEVAQTLARKFTREEMNGRW